MSSALKGISVWCEYSLADQIDRIQHRSLPVKNWEKIFEGAPVSIETELFAVDIKCVAPSQIESSSSDNFDFEVVTSLKFQGLLHRFAVVLHTHEESRGIIDRNGRHVVPLKRRSWLGTKGVVEIPTVGHDSSCAVFCVRGLTSMEYDRASYQVWMNVDFSDDHLMVHDDRAAIARDRSATEVCIGQEFRSCFRIISNTSVVEMPALLPHRNGCHATLIFTEHACVTALETHEAVYFGESGQRVNSGRGFVGHRIPVSKSIFYSNLTEATNASQSPHFPGSMVSLVGNSSFAEFVEEIFRLGIAEVGLHCVGPQTSDAAELARACQVMAAKFKSRFWIDHVWFKPSHQTTGSKEGFCMEGLPWRGQSYRESDALWRQYAVRYFWNTAPDYLDAYWTEKIRASGCFGDRLEYSDVRHATRSGIDSTDPDLDGLSRPLYWKHPNIDSNFVSWPAKGVADLVHDLSSFKIEELLAHGGVANLHCYPTYAGRASTWEYQDGKAVITTAFDQALERISQLRDQGKLSIDHLSTYIDYLEALESVSWVKSADGQVELRCSSPRDLEVTTSRKVRFNEPVDVTSYWGTSVEVEHVRGSQL